jgi:uncharacterized protein with GYD domain
LRAGIYAGIAVVLRQADQTVARKSVRPGLQYKTTGGSMPTYITLLKWTPQGFQNIKQSPSRLDAARKGFEAAGVKMKNFYMVTGQYDMVAIVEAPDDITLAKAMLSTAAQGNITSETCRAYTEEEYRTIVGGVV